MPLFLEPGKKLAIWLESDEHKPIESRPVFFVRSLSMRQQEALSDVVDEVSNRESTKELFQANCDLLNEHITGWANMSGMVHGKDDLQSFLSYLEARELLRKVLKNQFLQLDEKKSSEPLP